MKILVYGINYSPELTGIGKYTSDLSNFLSQRKHQVKVITAYPYYPEWRIHAQYKNKILPIKEIYQQKDEYIEINRCPLWVPKNPNGIKRFFHLLSFILSSLPSLCAQIFWKPDLIIVIEPTFLCVPQALLFAKIVKCKSMLHIQDFEFDAAYNFRIIRNKSVINFLKKIELRLMNYFDLISTISISMQKNLLNKKINPKKCYFLPNWIDIKSFDVSKSNVSKLKSKLNIPNNKLIVLFSGSLGAKQGLNNLSEIINYLADMQDILFLICGNGPLKEKLQNNCKDFKNVTFISLQDEKIFPTFLQIADIHILLQIAGSKSAVMPSRLLGMLASGKPIVAMAEKGSDVRKIVDQCGFVTDPGDIFSFSTAIIKLAKNKKLRNRKGTIARSIAKSKFSKKLILTDLEKSLTKLFGK